MFGGGFGWAWRDQGDGIGKKLELAGVQMRGEMYF